MQRLLRMVGALGLGLVITGAIQADDHKKSSKHKQGSSPATGNTTPAGNATTSQGSSSGSATLSSGVKAASGIQWKLGGLAGGTQSVNPNPNAKSVGTAIPGDPVLPAANTSGTLQSTGAAFGGGMSATNSNKNSGGPLQKLPNIITAATNKSAADKAVKAAQLAADAAVAKNASAQTVFDQANKQYLAAKAAYDANPQNNQTAAAYYQAIAIYNPAFLAKNQAGNNVGSANAALAAAKAADVTAGTALKSAILGSVLPGASSGAGGGGAPSGVAGTPSSAGMSTAFGQKTSGNSLQKLPTVITAATNKSAADKAAKAAQTAADKAAADLKVATDKAAQANTLNDAAFAAYQANQTTENAAKFSQTQQATTAAESAQKQALANNSAALVALGAAKTAESKAGTDLKAAVLGAVLPGGGTPQSGGTFTDMAKKISGNSGQKGTDLKTAATNKAAADKALKDAQAAADSAAANAAATDPAVTKAKNDIATLEVAVAYNSDPKVKIDLQKAEAAYVKALAAQDQAVNNNATAQTALSAAKAADIKASADLQVAVDSATMPTTGGAGTGSFPGPGNYGGAGPLAPVIVANYAPNIPATVELVAPVVLTPAAATGIETAEAVADAVPQYQRYLQIRNDTGKPLTISVQYHTKTDQGQWAWFPIDMAASSKGNAYNIAPGQMTYLAHQGGKLSASRIRLWVKADDGTWTQYADQDTWLVPEVDKQGTHVYSAKEMEIFAVQLSP